MKKTILAMLMAGAAAAQAAPVSVSITVTGAQYVSEVDYQPYSSGWEPSTGLVVSFDGEDFNGDSVISRNELTSLTAVGDNFFHVDFLAPADMEHTYYLWDFNYRSPQDYSVRLGFTYGYNPPVIDWSQTVTFTQATQQWAWFDENGSRVTFSSTSDSIVSVVSSVPEPTTLAMLALGLCVVGLGARRGGNTAG